MKNIVRRVSIIESYFGEALMGILKVIFKSPFVDVPVEVFDKFIDKESLMDREANPSSVSRDKIGLKIEDGEVYSKSKAFRVELRCNSKLVKPKIVQSGSNKTKCYRIFCKDNNRKIVLMKNYIKLYFLENPETMNSDITFATGTNRFVTIVNQLVCKIAVDKAGCVDNFHEFVMAKELQPEVAKCYECNGMINVCEYASVILDSDDIESKYAPEMQGILKRLHSSMGVSLAIDVGSTSKNISNWGLRKSRKPIIVDYGYVYKNSTALANLRCEVCGCTLIPNKSHSGLICSNESCNNLVKNADGENVRKVYGSSELHLLLTPEVREKMYNGLIQNVTKVDRPVSYFYQDSETEYMELIDEPTEDQIHRCNIETKRRNAERMEKLRSIGTAEEVEDALEMAIDSYYDGDTFVITIIRDLIAKWVEADLVSTVQYPKDLLLLRSNLVNKLKDMYISEKEIDELTDYFELRDRVLTISNSKYAAGIDYYVPKFQHEQIEYYEDKQDELLNLISSRGSTPKISDIPYSVKYTLSMDTNSKLNTLLNLNKDDAYTIVKRWKAIDGRTNNVDTLINYIVDLDDTISAREIPVRSNDAKDIIKDYIISKTILFKLKEKLMNRLRERYNDMKDEADNLVEFAYTSGREGYFKREFLMNKQLDIYNEIKDNIKKGRLCLSFDLARFGTAPFMGSESMVNSLDDGLKAVNGGKREYIDFGTETKSYLTGLFNELCYDNRISNVITKTMSNKEVKITDILFDVKGGSIIPIIAVIRDGSLDTAVYGAMTARLKDQVIDTYRGNIKLLKNCIVTNNIVENNSKPISDYKSILLNRVKGSERDVEFDKYYTDKVDELKIKAVSSEEYNESMTTDEFIESIKGRDALDNFNNYYDMLITGDDLRNVVSKDFIEDKNDMIGLEDDFQPDEPGITNIKESDFDLDELMNFINKGFM